MEFSHAEHAPTHRRTLNVFVLAMLSLAVVISLRNLPLTAAYGLSSLFFYAVAAICFMIPYALVSAELASGWPKAGGVYVWVKEALGERWGFFAIWMQWFHNMTWYPVMLAFIGSALAQLFAPELSHNNYYLMAVVVIGFWGITFLNFLGIKTSAWFSTICVIIGAILPGLFLIGLGINWVLSGQPLALNVSPSHFLPDFSDHSQFIFLAGIFLALAGLEANANLAREVKNPQKNYPKAIFLGACMTLGILILGSLAIAMVIPKEDIFLVSGLIDAFRAFFAAHNLLWLVPIVVFFTIFGALGELNAWAIAGAKGLFVTTESGSLPPVFHKVNRFHTPTRLLLFQAIVVTIAAFIFLFIPEINQSYWILSALSAQMYLLMYILLFVSGLVLRYRKPLVIRAYSVPGGRKGIWIVSIVGILACIFAFVMSLFPLSTLPQEQIARYEYLMVGGIFISVAIPLILHALRKPHWRKEVQREIREEIHLQEHPN